MESKTILQLEFKFKPFFFAVIMEKMLIVT